MCYLQAKPPLRDWRKLGKCQKVIKHNLWVGGVYCGVAVNSEGLLAVTDDGNRCVHLLAKDGTLVRSIGEEQGELTDDGDRWVHFSKDGALVRSEGELSDFLSGIAFDVKGNVLVTDCRNNEVVKLSIDGKHLQTLRYASSRSDGFNHPTGVSVSTEGLIYICDRHNHRVTVHDEEGKFLFSFGSKGSGPGCFDGPRDITFGSDGLVYITDVGNKRVSVWSTEGTFLRDFKVKYTPTCIAATSDNHLITSYSIHNVMVYTLEGELVHEFGGRGSDPGRFWRPCGICVDDDGLVYVADEGKRRNSYWSSRVQVF